MKPKPSKIWSVLCSLVLALFLFSAAVAAPILCRGFYYVQIGGLGLPAQTGWSEETIRGAFDGVMDYLVKDAPFGTGELKWSESGMEHFADCKVLFQLDFKVLGVTAAVLLALVLLKCFHKIDFHRFCRRGPCFWAAVGIGAVFAGLVVWGFVSFDSLFVAFHTVFFPGKVNWLFDPATDEIIRILPDVFFARCGLLVVGLSLGGGVVLAVVEAVLTSRRSGSAQVRTLGRKEHAG